MSAPEEFLLQHAQHVIFGLPAEPCFDEVAESCEVQGASWYRLSLLSNAP